MCAHAQIDINHADAKALAESMTGVGLVKAEAIVAYRLANGPFKTANDLINVKGIGEKTLEANRSDIVIVAPETAPATLRDPKKRPLHPAH